MAKPRSSTLDKPPLFSIGEEVVLQSVMYPELNGACVVISTRINKYTGKRGYRTTIKAPSMVGNPQGTHWTEAALRKKPTPSEFSFSDLMEHLKTEVVSPA